MDKQMFLNGIHDLTTDSTHEEIGEFLCFDMKSLAVIDHEKMYSDKIFFSNEYVSLTYQDIFERANISLDYQEYTNGFDTECIKNWLCYRIATTWGKYDNGKQYEMGLYTDISFDCDSTEVVKEVLKQVLVSKVDAIMYHNDYGCNGDNRFTISPNIHLTTDTMNSFATTFNVLVELIFKKYGFIPADESYRNFGLSQNIIERYQIENIIEYLPYPVKAVYQNMYILENIDTWTNSFSDEEKELLENVNELALLYHTIGNFTLVPKGYNSGRVKLTNDYWDLSLLDLKGQAMAGNYTDKNYQWYLEHYSLFLLDAYFEKDTNNTLIQDNNPIPLFDNHLNSYYQVLSGSNRSVEIPQNIDELNICINSMCRGIMIRGTHILSSLNNQLSDSLFDDMYGFNQNSKCWEAPANWNDWNEVINLSDEDDSTNTEHKEESQPNVAIENHKKKFLFSGNTLEKCSNFLAVFPIFIAILNSVITYGMFLKMGGYNEYNSLSEPDYLMSGNVWGMLFILSFCFSALLMGINYIKNHSGIRKIVMIVLTVFQIILFILPIIFQASMDLIGQSSWFNLNPVHNSQLLQNYVKIYFVVCFLSIILPFIVFLFEQAYRKFVKRYFISFCISVLLIPLMFGFLGNKISAFVLAVVIVIIGGKFLYHGIKYRCPECKKLNALRCISQTLIDESTINIKVTNQTKDTRGNVTGSTEQWIPGLRQMYNCTYQCKYCGSITHRTKTQDVENA